jgi:hypothetical protein
MLSPRKLVSWVQKLSMVFLMAIWPAPIICLARRKCWKNFPALIPVNEWTLNQDSLYEVQWEKPIIKHIPKRFTTERTKYSISDGDISVIDEWSYYFFSIIASKALNSNRLMYVCFWESVPLKGENITWPWKLQKYVMLF